jgi:hypothetical protein
MKRTMVVMWRHIVQQVTDIAGEHVVSISRVKEYVEQADSPC